MEAMAPDENSQGNSSAQQAREAMTLGRGPFQRDPGSAAAAAAAVAAVGKSMAESSKKLHPQVLLVFQSLEENANAFEWKENRIYCCLFELEKEIDDLLNKGSKTKDIGKQNCSSPGDSVALEKDKLQVLNKGMTTVKNKDMDKQSCSSDGDSGALEQEKDTSSSGVVGVKRKAETLDILSNGKKTSTTNKDSQKKWHCSLCGISATSEKGLNDHLEGKKHKNKEASSKFNDPNQKISSEPHSNRLHCSLCDTYIPSEKRLKVHLEGRKHKAKEAKLGKSGQVDVQTEAMNTSVGSKEILNVAFAGRKQEAEQGVSCQENDDMGSLSDKEVSREGLKGGENPQDEHDLRKPIPDLGKQEENKKENTRELRLKKSWHCQMCNLRCNDEVEMTAHRRGSEHMSLLLKKRGGVIVGSRIPEEKALEKCGKAAEQETSVLLEAAAAKRTSPENRPEIQESKQEIINSVSAEKYWHCHVCNETHDEPGIAAHRKSSQHISLAQKNGGVIVASRTVEAAKGALHEIAKYISYPEGDVDVE